ncbi:HCP-like protein [Gigaspora margarita]|uniref:HCP-like protein n=1 Tax=Gigaspora margarita TaxID=4874 RepID=A0A8H4AVR4_GIGMA|nr:HCP-like protein [Gigaspora margarita]
MNTPSSGSMDNASLCFRIINGTREEPVPGTPEEKNPIHARKLFKEAADEYNQYVSQLRYAAESQFRYALLLLGDLRKESNETMKDKLYKEILHYLELATEYSENSSDNAMYYLGYIYVFGKFEAKMDEMRGIKYLRRAARNDNYRAVALLANLENGEVPLILFDKGKNMHKKKIIMEKDPIRARQLFKEIADKYNHSEAQCRYAFLLLDDIKKVTNEPEKAANNNNDRAIVLLAKLADKPEIEDDEIPEEVPIISLKDSIEMHRNKEYKKAWECFKQNADLSDPVAKFWIAADENNHAESQCRYAVLLLSDLGKETDEAANNKLIRKILYYFELAAENPENRNADTMYYLVNIYVTGKLKVKKDEERLLKYLRLAANNKNKRAIALLKKLNTYVD